LFLQIKVFKLVKIPASHPSQDQEKRKQEFIVGQDSRKELKDLTTSTLFISGSSKKAWDIVCPFLLKLRKSTQPREYCCGDPWLQTLVDLLDQAYSPSCARFPEDCSDYEIAHALLRYFTSKASVRAGDRDKTDCIITYYFVIRCKRPRCLAPAEVDSSYAFISQASLAFEGELYRALEDVPCESMTPEHVHFLQEFEYLYQELEEFRHFDQIIDSGIVQRVRELKQSLGKSFYHPDALACVAVWNDLLDESLMSFSMMRPSRSRRLRKKCSAMAAASCRA